MASKKSPSKHMIMTLAKVVIAAAWADGEITHDEINCLKDLLFQLRGLDAREWASLDIYMSSPVSAEERSRLLDELMRLIRSTRDKELALQALDDIMHADGEVTESEQQVVEEIKAAIDSTSVGVLGGVGKLVSVSLKRRSKALAGAPNREQDFDEFVRNKILFNLRQRLSKGEFELEIPEAELKKLSLVGGLMARVANVNRKATSTEIGAMVEALRQEWSISPDTAAFVAEVAVSKAASEVDYFRLTREFFACTSAEERARLLDVLFAVAASDGDVSFAETEEIRKIASGLKLSHRQFINAKLKAARS